MKNMPIFVISREYYFSDENLTKDFFLRRQMDSDGWVFISLIASFHRMKNLTNDINVIVNVSSKKM